MFEEFSWDFFLGPNYEFPQDFFFQNLEKILDAPNEENEIFWNDQNPRYLNQQDIEEMNVHLHPDPFWPDDAGEPLILTKTTGITV